MPYKLILFDLDGTLLDTLEDLAAAVNHALAVRGLPLHSLQEYRAMVGHGVRNLVQQALEKSLDAAGKPDDALIDAALADFKACYTAHIDVHTRALLFDRPFYVSEPVSTPPEHPSTPLQSLVYETFAKLAIPFVRVDTDPGITMEDCGHISARIGVDIVKTVFLCNRQQTDFYLYAMPAGKPFVTRDFCAALGIPRVSFASADKLRELTGAAPGATTILSSVWPAASGVRLVLDRAVAEAPEFACTDGTPTCFVRLSTRDLLEKYLRGRETII